MINFTKFKRFCFSKKYFFHKCYKPFLLNNQINSFNRFISNKNKSLYSIKKITKSYFPIINKKKNIFIKIKKIYIENPYFSIKYIKKKNIHLYSKLYLYLEFFFITENISKIKKYYLGNIPFITYKGSFIINGTDKILISQFVKMNGIYFLKEKKNFLCKIIPLNGYWLEIILNEKNFIIFDKKINFEISALFICLGINKKIFLNFFFIKLKLKIIKGKKKIFFLLKKKNFLFKKIKKYICISFKKIIGNVFFCSYYSNILIKKLNFINLKKINQFFFSKFFFIKILILKKKIDLNYIIKIYKNYRLKMDENNYNLCKGKIINLFRKMINENFFNFSKIGLIIIKKKIFIKNINYIFLLEFFNKFLKFIKFNLKNDNFDNLENKLILNSGKLLSIRFNYVFKTLIKIFKIKVNNIKNLKFNFNFDNTILTNNLKDYFCNNELSQFLDQNNPLSEISHSRKISLISGIGIERENCGFDIRDIHFSHYCKICPVDTPEGHNIGLINSLSFFTKIDKFNRLTTPYKIVIFGKIIGFSFISPKKEKLKFICNYFSTIKTIYGEIFKFPFINVRNQNYYFKLKFFHTDFVEISTDQLFSVGVSIIPFLQCNDANRCLMGSNMQRQAVPLLFSDNPIIGTGNELILGLCSNYNIISEYNGYIIYLDNFKIIVKTNNLTKKYYLEKYKKTNQNTLLHQRILIKNYLIKKGDLLADSISTKNGEISLGKNIKVAYMSWYGYNFEDSILISKELIQKKKFNSLHIYEFISILKYSENGAEITSNECFNDLQIKLKKVKNGIIKKGSDVKPKDILIGKMIPKDKKDFSPEEKLFKIVFSENNFDYYEQPLLVPKNIYGTVIDIDDFNLYIFKKKILKTLKFEQIQYINKKICNYFYENFFFYINKLNKLICNKKVFYKDKIFYLNKINLNLILKIKCLNKKINYMLKILKKILLIKIIKLQKKFVYKKENLLKYDDYEKSIIRIIKIKIAVNKNLKIGDKMSGRHGNKGVVSNIIEKENMPYDKNGQSIQMILNPLGIPSRMNVGQLLEVFFSSSLNYIKNIIFNINKKNFSLNKIKFIIKILFEYIMKKKININNINKNNILKIFNNIKFGLNICIHNFEQFNINKLKNLINIFGYSKNGKVLLFDGITGKRFIQLINVGIIYFMKLNHLVIDKIYSRSIGPYSLITQQPLGGKSNLGGQRLGEMEVWAIEAYGAAHILKEMLTVKSDDVIGRIKLYKNLIKGFDHVDSGIPESFQVLIKEIQSLCFDIKTI